MSQGAEDLRDRTAGRFARVLWTAILALGLSVGAVAGNDWSSPGKGLYYAGSGFVFNPAPGGGLTLTQMGWNGTEWAAQWSTSWPITPSGPVGACVFDGKIYGFFIGNALGFPVLYDVTADPVARTTTGPTYLVGTPLEGGNQGVAAAVSNGWMMVFLSGDFGANEAYGSRDGQNFLCSEFSCLNTNVSVLDAVTFEPSGSDPESIMLVYDNPSTSPATLGASMFSLPANWSGSWFSSTRDFTLPWPPAAPYLWQPLTQGSLLLGTSGGGINGSPGGRKEPCIQLYGLTAQGQDGIHQGRWEFGVASGTWTFTDITSPNTRYLVAFPYSDTMDPVRGTMRLSHILSYANDQARTFFADRSDWMVPQNNDPSYGWNGTPTTTADAAVGSELASLWTLVGVVLGPPPFAMNDDNDACIGMTQPRSWVSYGQGASTTVTTTSTSSSKISIGLNYSIKTPVAGFGIANASMDYSYAHAWTSSHSKSATTSVSNSFTFSPCFEPVGGQGTHGWGIFNAPTLVTQWYKLYAYDYDPSSGQGTYMDQDVYATALGDSTLQIAYFDLVDPSGGEFPGLFAGMPAYPNSTDIPGWHLNVPEWDSGGSDWSAIFGDRSTPPVAVLNLGAQDEETFTQSTTTVESKGNSNSFSVKAGVGASFPLEGFKIGVSVGYDGQWTTTTENDTTVTDSVSFALNVPIPPNTPGYVKSETVQPFWLTASTPNAPWIPAGYHGNLPWCITWGVPGYSVITATGSATAGLAAAPSSASGTVRHGGDKAKDSYTLGGGRMAWLNPDGTETPVPMTAEQFVVSRGASVSLNHHVFAADGSKGNWSRSGDVWTYRTRQDAKGDHFTLGLDFANQTWSFDGSSKTLDQDLKAADASVRIGLALQGDYAFSNWLEHGVKSAWGHQEKKSTWQAYGVHEIEGACDPKTGVGNLKLKGHIPKRTASFGDVEIRVNGAPVRFPLLATKDFLKHLKNHGKASYRADGLTFDVDFGSGMWKATIAGSQFKGGMVPKSGAMQVQVLLGGTPISDQTFVIQKCTAALSYPYTTGP